MALKRAGAIQVVLLAATVIGLSGASAWSQQTIELAAYTFPPYSFKSADGTYTGADIEITAAVFQRLGFRIRWLDLPFNRALLGIQKGLYAGIAPCVASEDRKVYTHFSSIPTAALERVFFKRKERRIFWKRYEDLRGLTVGACDYSYPQHFWDAGKAGIFTISMVKSAQPDLSNFRKLALGRIDILIIDRAVGLRIIKDNAPQFDMIGVVPAISVDKTPVPFSFGLSKPYWSTRGTQGMDLLKAYEKELDRFVKEGRRNEIFTRYDITYALDADNHIILE